MSTIAKTAGVEILPLQAIGSASVIIGAVQDVSTKLGVCIFVHFARDNTSALTNPVVIRVEGSAKGSGNDQWFVLTSAACLTSAPAVEAVSGTVAAGAVDIAVTSTTGFAAGDIVLIKASTVANSEWARVLAFTVDTKLTVIEAITRAATGATLYNKGELFTFMLDLTSVTRLRIVIDNSVSGQTCVAEAFMVSGDSIG